MPKFNEPDPWRGDGEETDFIRQARNLQKNYDELHKEFLRVCTELQREKIITENLKEANLRADHYKAQNVLLVAKMSSLVMTIEGALPNAGTAILSAFKQIGMITKGEIAEMKELVKQQQAVNAEQAQLMRKKSEEEKTGRDYGARVETALEYGKREGDLARDKNFDDVIQTLEESIQEMIPEQQPVTAETEVKSVVVEVKEEAQTITQTEYVAPKDRPLLDRVTSILGRK